MNLFRSSVLLISIFFFLFITMESMWSCDQIVLFHRCCLITTGTHSLYHTILYVSQFILRLLLFSSFCFYFCSLFFSSSPELCLFNLRIMDFNMSQFFFRGNVVQRNCLNFISDACLSSCCFCFVCVCGILLIFRCCCSIFLFTNWRTFRPN